MRKVPIKFRGESAIGTVYGYFVKRDGKAYIANDVGSMVTVEEESVKQLCGYNKNGEEVYEGDDELLCFGFTVKQPITIF